MVAELTGIPVSASLSNGSSRPKTLKSKIIGNIVGRRACHAASSTFSSRVTSGNRVDEIAPNRGNSTRPRWIRNATREPIYSVLDDRETVGSRENRYAPSSRTGGSAKTLGYEISAVRHRESARDNDTLPFYRENNERNSIVARERREIGARCLPIDEESPSDNDPLPIYREKHEESAIGAKDRQEIDIGNRPSEEESESEEYELYSVVRKPPKLVFPAAEASKLPILEEELEEEAAREEKREEALKKQRELRKWLESATPRRESTAIGKVKKSARSAMISEDTAIERIDDEDAEIGSGGEKSDTDWSSPGGVSIPRGVIGMVGPFCRVYRNPNEQREYMLREEFQERGIDVGDDNAASVPANGIPRVYEDLGNNEAQEEEEEESLTIVDSVSDAGTFVDRSDEEALKEMKKMANSIADDESLLVVEEQLYRPRAKWRFSDEDEPVVTNKNDDTVDKSKIGRVWPSDRANQPKLNSKDNYDLEVPPKYTSKRSEASNEPHDKDSLNETGSTTGGTVEGNHSGNPGRGERSAGPSEQLPSTEGRPASNTAPPPRSLVSRILARARSSDNLLDHSEPYSQLWIVLSNVYGELVVVLMMALCLAEVMDTPVPLLSLQSVFLMYLYVGSIAVIISIYFWVLVDSCGSLTGGRAEDAELGGGASLTRFGSLKRAHISRARTAPTSFYIRVGALLFGLATLVFNGLEMAMHTMMQGAECLSDIIFVHPVLHGLFTFLQMHFLFVNSQVLVERFGLAARFGFTHLAATNIAVWARLVIWDSAQEWTYFVHLAQRGPETSSSPLNLRGFPGSLTRRARDLMGKSSPDGVVLQPYQPISPEQISQVVTLHECLNTNTLGQLWTSSMPFLYPFIVQFSLIAAAVTFVMGQNVGRNRYCHKQKFHSSKDLAIHSRVGCDGSSKGLFLGILCMTAGIVVILIFLVVREDDNFSPATLSWLTCGTLIGILTLSSAMTASGLVQVRQMSVVSRAPATLDALLSNVALFGVQLYAVFTAVVCACSLATHEIESQDPESRGRHAMLLAVSILQLAQCCAQSTLIAETSKRSCITRCQMMAKPARQVVTFLLFSNAVLWAFDTVVTQNWVSQELQLRFFGVLAWGIVSRICLPLVVFYRFHSCVLLLEAWNKCYRIPRGEHPLN